MTDEAKTYTEAQVQELIKSRTSELRESRNTLQAELNELRPTATAWETKATGFKAELDALSGVSVQLTELQQKHVAAEARWGQDRVLLAAGLGDAEVGEVLRLKYANATEPGEFSDWFEREGRQVPMVSAFLSSSPQGSTPPPPAAETALPAPTSPTMPSSNNGTKPAPPAAQPYTAGSISGMTREEFKTQRADLLASVKLPFN